MRDDGVYFEHMLTCIANIQEDVSGGAFPANRTIRDAVMYNLQVMVESSKRVSPAMKERFPAVPWRALSDFRNVLVHGYMDVDYERIAGFIRDYLPPLKQEVERMLASLP